MSKMLSYLTPIILDAFASFFSFLPRRCRLFIGRQLGVFIYIASIRKNVARMNLKIAFKDKDSSEIEVILLNCYKHFGVVFLDFLNQQSINKENISDYIIFNKKDKKLLQESNGGCIMSAHIGSWEMVLPAMGLNGIKMETVIREQKNKMANDYYIKIRSFPNIGLVWKKESLRKLYDAINENKFIGLASDQNAREKGIKIDFFDKEASFPKGAGIVHGRTGAKVFVVLSILGSDLKYHIYVKPISSDKKEENEIVKDIASQYTRILENKIRQQPHQYFWFHKKWNKKIYK